MDELSRGITQELMLARALGGLVPSPMLDPVLMNSCTQEGNSSTDA